MKYSFIVISALLIFAGITSCKKESNDRVKPWIELLGNNPTYCELGKPYIDEGAIVWDVNETGDTVNITSHLRMNDNINTDKVGEYKVYYNAADDAGNQADQVVRVVYVQIFK